MCLLLSHLIKNRTRNKVDRPLKNRTRCNVDRCLIITIHVHRQYIAHRNISPKGSHPMLFQVTSFFFFDTSNVSVGMVPITSEKEYCPTHHITIFRGTAFISGLKLRSHHVWVVQGVCLDYLAPMNMGTWTWEQDSNQERQRFTPSKR